MAQVTGLTAARMLEIEAASVVDGLVSGDDLILQKYDGTIINAGNVRGPAGLPGPPGLSQQVNVKDPQYGAVGDGVTDDTAAIRKAQNVLALMGGGILFFPPGVYLMLGVVQLSSNTHVMGFGATLSKAQGGYACFSALGGDIPGYGAGASNLMFTGLTIKGSLPNGMGACLLAAHHSQNIFVQNCRFVECIVGGHALDLCGCRHVEVDNCVFAGSAALSGDQPEAIQIDQSGASSVSVSDGTASYDGLPTVDVTVTNCRFEELTVNGVKYKAPAPFGSHTAPTSGKPYSNLTFENNYVETIQTNTSGYYGYLHFLAAKTVKILNNTFINDGTGDTPFIGTFNWSGGPNVDMLIQGNTFIGTVPTSTPLRLTYVAGLRFIGNTGIDIASLGGSKYMMWVYSSSRVIVTENDFQAPAGVITGTTGMIFGSSVARGRLDSNLVTGYGTNISNASTTLMQANNVTT